MSQDVSTGTATGTLGALGGSLIALLLVVALILALAWLLRRLPGASRSNPDLRVVAQIAVGVRERVVVIAVGGQQYLLGVTSENVRLIDRLDTPLGDPPRTDFRQLLRSTERAP